MNIRTYENRDKEACTNVFKSNTPEYFAPFEISDFESWLDKQAQDATNLSTGQYYVVELDNKLVGCGGFYIDHAKNEAGMVWGMIDRSLHRTGIGRKLILYRIEAIKKACADCAITLNTSQYSYPFFEKTGFRVTKITKNFYAKGLDRYDMVFNQPL